jgi:FkbM family methyltransferase
MDVKNLLPERAKAKVRPWRWPRPAWAVRGHGELLIGGERLRFVDIGHGEYQSWARRAVDGGHEPEVAGFLRDNIRPGDVFFDVGAYTGQYTLLGARRGARVVTFEPDPVSQQIVLRNLALNGLEANLVAAAVGLPDDFAQIDPQKIGRSTSRAGTAPGLEVRTVGLDDYCTRHGLWPDVIKVDIEGAEAIALGESASGVRARVRAMVVEVHRSELAEQGIDPDGFIAQIGAGMRRIPLGDRGDRTLNVGFVRD